MKLWILRIALIAAGACLALATLAQAQSTDADGCSNRTLQGDYAFTIHGQISGPSGPSLRDGVAMTHFDGEGGLTQVDFIMSNGTPTPGPADPVTGFHTHETGTYTVYSDCTGRAEIDFPAPPMLPSGAVLKLMFVLSNHGRTIHTIVSEAIPPGSSTPIPVSIHSDAERLGWVRSDDDR